MFGVPEIDQQHQELVSMLNRLTDAVHNEVPRKEIYRMIDEVIAYTCAHFAAEERLMAESGYPEFEAHRNKHNQLVQDALHLKKKLDYVGEDRFMEWFNHWPFANILAHIQYADQQVGDHVTRGTPKKDGG